MRSVPASEMKNRLGAYIEAAQAEPLLVERSGRPSVVMLSVAEFERLKALEHQVRSGRAQQWLEDNRQAIDDFNAHVERDGVFSDGLRGF